MATAPSTDSRARVLSPLLRMKSKVSTDCGKTKNIYLFGRLSSTKAGYSRVCAACRHEHRRESRTGKPRGYAWRGTLRLPGSPD